MEIKLVLDPVDQKDIEAAQRLLAMLAEKKPETRAPLKRPRAETKPEPAPAPAPDTDESGRPWVESLHSPTRHLYKSGEHEGLWRRKRGVTAEDVEAYWAKPPKIPPAPPADGPGPYPTFIASVKAAIDRGVPMESASEALRAHGLLLPELYVSDDSDKLMAATEVINGL